MLTIFAFIFFAPLIVVFLGFFVYLLFGAAACTVVTVAAGPGMIGGKVLRSTVKILKDTLVPPQ